METVDLLAPAKINLSLDVIGKRINGYHDVRMIMQSISLADQVRVTRRDHGVRITSNVYNIPLNDNNIAVKAWELMRKKFHLPGGLDIHLQKEIPVEAGLAGGSTNAAAVLKGVNTIYNLGLSDKCLAEIASNIGADVAFCVIGGTALAEGIGEILSPLPSLPEAWLVLVNPGFGVSTRDIYQLLDWKSISRRPDTNALVQAVKNADWHKVSLNMVNVLEEVTLKKYPELQQIKKAFAEEGLYPLMSGSGPTVFGIADTYEKAVQAAEKVKNRWKIVLVAHTV
ncbi:MAG: 4-(cytidine 5'-diphospho)-2-C-methyl-D-erythritol kinase [Dehalobacterium sp.]